ncbi:MAG: SagB-type dehydrogenase family enzyme [Halobacteriales archaeon]|jgi:SagB-type dehydrogenase family enzyme
MGKPLTRRTVARITALVTVGGSILLGWLVDAFDIDGAEEESPDEEGPIPKDESVPLPRPDTAAGDKRVADAIANRRSRREYGTEPLTAAELGQLLWAAQGITERHQTAVDFRAAPSAGATYPLELFVVIGDPGVDDLDPGIYHYDLHEHRLERIESGTVQPELERVALDQEWVGTAALDIVITAVDERTTQRYGRRGRQRYVPMEAGHVGENIYLQAESLGLSTVAIGAFRDTPLRNLLGVPDSHRPLYIYPVGQRA